MRTLEGLREVQCPWPEERGVPSREPMRQWRELSGGAAGSTAPRTRGAGSSAPRDEPEAKRRREASNLVIQENHKMSCGHSGAVVGSQAHAVCATQEAEGMETKQLDLKDAVVSEIFCKKSVCVESTEFWAPFTIDIVDEPDQEKQA